MSQLRDKYRHRAGWENAPVQASCRAFRPPSSRRGAGLSSWGVLPYSSTKRTTVFRTARGRAALVGRKEMDVRSWRVGSTHAWRGRQSKRSVGCWDFGFGGRCFDTSGCFLFRIPSSRFSGCCGFGLKLLRPCHLPGGGHFRLLGRLRDQPSQAKILTGGGDLREARFDVPPVC